MRPTALLACLLALTITLPARAQAAPAATGAQVQRCEPGKTCLTGLTAAQVLRLAEEAVLAGDYARAAPLLDALAADARYAYERIFLTAYIAGETGDHARAIRLYSARREEGGEQPRVRLELARAQYLAGQPEAARKTLAGLPLDSVPEVVRETVETFNRALARQRPWYADARFGIAPDSNVNAATQARTIDLFGLPFALNEDARRRTGTGQTAQLRAGVRLPLAPAWSMVIDTQANLTNYKGNQFDDLVVDLTAGPVWQRGDWQVQLAASGTHRWYGWDDASSLYGGQLNLNRALDATRQVGLELGVRRIDNHLNRDATGWQYSAFLGLEQLLGGRLLASLGVLARHEPVRARTLSSDTLGLTAGIGGELAPGLHGGLSVQAARAWYGGQSAALGVRRKDWRLETRAYLGLTRFAWAGFSPVVEYRFSATDSTVPLYDFDRHRVDFGVQRFF